MRLPVDDFACTGVCYGTFTGWVNHRTDVLAVTVEFGETVPDWRISRAANTVVAVGSRARAPRLPAPRSARRLRKTANVRNFCVLTTVSDTIMATSRRNPWSPAADRSLACEPSASRRCA